MYLFVYLFVYLFIYLFIYLFFNFLKFWEYSLRSIMKNQKQPIFFKIHKKIPEQESHFNKLSYLKAAILLKKRLQQCFTV